MTIDKRSLTTGEFQGSGIFDELMRSVKSHVQLELTEGRINEQSYSTVYLSALQYALQASLQYTLQYEKTNADLALSADQLLQSQKQNELLTLQKTQLGITNTTAQYNLDNILPQQVLKNTADIALVVEQKLLIQEQISTQQKQQLELDAKTLLIAKQDDLVDEQILAATYQYTNPTAGLLHAQYEKMQKEIDILGQKKLTEDAQTVGTEATIGGLVGNEMQLKKVQADSFLRDAEQKAAKLFADAFQIMFSVNPDGGVASNSDPAHWGINVADSTAIFAELKTGVTAP